MFAAFAPIWALTAIGYLVARSRILGPGAVDVLGRFVFYIAMPAALFGMLTTRPLTGFAGKGLLAVVAATLLVGGAGFAAARWIFRRSLADRTLAGMAAGYVNAGNLGIPVTAQVLGTASFIAVVLMFQVLLLAPTVLTLLDVATRAGSAGRWRQLVTLPLRTPILVACVVGAALGAAHVRPPAFVAGIVGLLGAAAVPTALVALGLSLVRPDEPDGEPRRPAELALSVVLKTVVQPVLAYVIGRYALGLHGDDLLAVVLCAGLPTAQNTFVFARAYGVDGRFARDAIVLSTAVSMVTLTAVGLLVG